MSDHIEPRDNSAQPRKDLDAESTLDLTTPTGALPEEELGTVGRYRLLRKLGEGGMGQVWLAEQTEPVQRQVALKLIRAGRYDRRSQERFQIEQQALAIMEHPAIAKVFDADATPEGQPYFVMEYVPGPPVTVYCDQKKLALRDRLALFIRVCEGVQHAHHKAIIHRDLKPSNVLVAEIDGKPVPRIIDFGIAKDASAAPDETLVTGAGAMVGTPGYMSPEQADPNVRDVDTRADVYSLGVILYELLTSSPPFDPGQWKKKPLHEVLRQLQEEDPPTPSTRVSSDDQRSKAVAENRRTEARQLITTLRGDLDWIALKALERDRQRRYGSPMELADDIRRYLRNEPVNARPASAVYRFRKYVRRHRVGVGVASLLVVLLATFGVTEFLQVKKITRERDRANRIAEFMAGMFKVPDPSEAKGNTVTAREILDKGSQEIESGLAKDPDVQAQLTYTMAKTYSNLGLFSRAFELAQQARREREQQLGSTDPKTLSSRIQVGWMLWKLGKYSEAESATQQALNDAKRHLGPDSPITMEAINNLAIVFEKQGRYAEEEKLLREAVAGRTRILGPDDPQTLQSKANLAGALELEQRWTEAEPLHREVLAAERRVFGETRLQTLNTMHNLANMLQAAGRYDEAETLYRQTLAIEEKVLGPENPDTANTLNNLANTLVYTPGRYKEAEGMYRRALAVKRKALGDDHPYTMYSMEGLANVLSTEGEYAEAEKLYREVLAIRLRTLGPEHTDTLLTQYNIASVLRSEGRYSEAEKLLRELLPVQARAVGAEAADTLASQTELAKVLLAEKRYDEAQQIARQAWEAQCKTLGIQHPDSLSTLTALAKILVATGHYSEAKNLFDGAIADITQAHAVTLPTAWYDYACVASAAKDSGAALEHLKMAIAQGYDAASLKDDDELRPLRGDPRFNALWATSGKQSR